MRNTMVLQTGKLTALCRDGETCFMMVRNGKIVVRRQMIPASRIRPYLQPRQDGYIVLSARETPVKTVNTCEKKASARGGGETRKVVADVITILVKVCDLVSSILKLVEHFI